MILGLELNMELASIILHNEMINTHKVYGTPSNSVWKCMTVSFNLFDTQMQYFCIVHVIGMIFTPTIQYRVVARTDSENTYANKQKTQGLKHSNAKKTQIRKHANTKLTHTSP